MNAQITEISNGYLVTIGMGVNQPQGEVLHNVGYIKELHELKGKITELTEDAERRMRQARDLKVATMPSSLADAIADNKVAAIRAINEGPRN